MLTREGIDNVVYDSHEKNAGSQASGNITKPSWLTGIDSEIVRQAYKDLDDMYGLRKFEPQLALGKTMELFYVHRDNVIDLPCMNVKVTEIGDGWLKVEGPGYKGHVQGPVLVAAGVWCNELIDMPKINSVSGVSFIFRKPDGYRPKFDVWAPYKQSISYNFNGHVWFGDGQAIQTKNWKDERVVVALERAAKHGLTDLPLETNVGYRPMVPKHKTGYFERVYEHTWVSTGGGKNGIVLAAIQARRFLEELKANDYC